MKSTEYLFFSNKNYRLYHIPQPHIIIVEGWGTIQLEVAQEAWMKALDKAEEHQIARWLLDGSAVELVSPKATEWISKEWLFLSAERLSNINKRVTATILPARFYAEMSSKSLIDKTFKYDAIIGEQEIDREHLYFKDFAQAYEWIATYRE